MSQADRRHRALTRARREGYADGRLAATRELREWLRTRDGAHWAGGLPEDFKIGYTTAMEEIRDIVEREVSR